MGPERPQDAFSPSRSTSPLPEFTSAITPLLPALELAWRNAFGHWLDPWQVELLERITELQNGILRFRQVIVSLPRQQGKTELMAVLAIWRLLTNPHALVIGIASNADQARLVYQRTKEAVDLNAALQNRFAALTDTRGLRTVAGGRYEIKAAKGSSLQGLPIDLGIADEVHLLSSDLWNALLNGTGGRDNCLVIGITTAGDQNSELLKHLYKVGDESLTSPDSRVGFFVWEAPEARVPESDEELAEFLRISNPAIACGRVNVSNVIADIRSMPEPDALRYRLNRFTAAQTTYISGELWARNGRGIDDAYPNAKSVFAIDVDPDLRYASIARATKDSSGLIHTELIASVPNPTNETLVKLCRHVARHGYLFVMDSYRLKALGEDLKRYGLPVRYMGMSDVINASSTLYSKLIQKKLRHGNDPLLTIQIPSVTRKNVGEAYKIVRSSSASVIDSVMATALAVYAAETQKPNAVQVFA